MTTNSAAFDWTTILMGEKLLFGLLGKLFYAEPDKTWLQSLVDEGVFDEVPFAAERSETARGLELLRSWIQANQASLNNGAFISVEGDYMRLFVGVGKLLAPPWESVYFNDGHMVFQVETLQVREWFRRFSVETEKLHKEPDDHVGLEFSFISHLATLALQALEAKDEARFAELLEAQHQFLTEHPLRWVPAWCDLVDQKAKTDYYRGLAWLAKGSLFSLAEIHKIPTPREGQA